MAPFLLDVAVMGLGKVGTSLVLGLSRMGYRVLASTANPERHKDIEAMGIEILPSFEAARRSEIVVIAVKPKQVRGLAEEIRGAVEGKLVISVAAALTTDLLEGLLPRARIIRAMPNLAIMVGESATAIAKGRSATEHDLEVAKRIFGAVGDCIVVEEELMDMITGLSGS
ncbi:MAG: NAD(P)-binding domain-containing protein, partial [Candidatus Korarchaeum sp.]